MGKVKVLLAVISLGWGTSAFATHLVDSIRVTVSSGSHSISTSSFPNGVWFILTGGVRETVKTFPPFPTVTPGMTVTVTYNLISDPDSVTGANFDISMDGVPHGGANLYTLSLWDSPTIGHLNRLGDLIGHAPNDADIKYQLVLKQDPAVLSVSPASLSFSAQQGGGLPASQDLMINNSGGGTLNWTLAEQLNASWLSESPTVGTAPSSVPVSITSTALTPGSYADTLIVSGNATNSPVKVPVTYTVGCPVSKGDMNGDNILTAADVVLLLNCTFLGIGNCDLAFADINCDGILTAADVVIELNMTFLGVCAPC